MKKNRWVSNLIKVLVSVGALAWVLSQIPLDNLVEAMQGADLGLLIIVYGLFNLSLVVRAGRWNALLQGLGSPVRFWRLVELYFVGSFFNAFLPSGFGGDVVRAAEAARDVEGETAVGTVIVDRLTGLLVLFVLALLALPFSLRELPAGVVWPIALLATLGLIFGFLFLHGGALRRLGPWLDRWLPIRLSAALSPTGEGAVGRVNRAITGCGWQAVTRALGASLIFNLMLIGWWYLAGKALGIDISIVAYATFVPMMSLAMMVPSIGGLGVRESIAPLLFEAAQVPDAKAVALSLVLFVLNRGTGIVGGLVYLIANLREMGDGRRG